MQAIPDSNAAERGLSYLRHQRGNGGFATGGNGAVNSQSSQYVAPKASPTVPRVLRDWRQVTRPARQASARGRGMAQTRAAPAPSSREPIQFRLAEGRN